MEISVVEMPITQILRILGRLREEADAGSPNSNQGGTLFPIDPSGEDGEEEQDAAQEETTTIETAIPPALLFERCKEPVTSLSVDCGVCGFGETSNGGIHFSLRSAVFTEKPDGAQHLATLRSGVICLAPKSLPQAFLALGTSLGDPGFYVSEQKNGDTLVIKQGVASSPSRIIDRFRAWWERHTQLIAVQTAPQGSLVILDGSLSAGSQRDTPDIFLQGMLGTASQRSVNILGLSKTSELKVREKAVRWWLEDTAGAAYRALYPMLEEPRRNRILGRTYAVRLGPRNRAQAYRADLVPAPKQSEAQVLSMLASVRALSGYPRGLAMAHAFSYIPGPIRAQMRANICSKYKLVCQDEKPLRGVFAPFHGAHK